MGFRWEHRFNCNVIVAFLRVKHGRCLRSMGVSRVSPMGRVPTPVDVLIDISNRISDSSSHIQHEEWLTRLLRRRVRRQRGIPRSWARGPCHKKGDNSAPPKLSRTRATPPSCPRSLHISPNVLSFPSERIHPFP
jgi:hypothetical protein